MTPVRHPGIVKWYDPKKAYGFIHSSLGDIFVHVSAFDNEEQMLKSGDKVEFTVESHEKGLRAVSVIIMEKSASFDELVERAHYLINLIAPKGPARARWWTNHPVRLIFGNFDRAALKARRSRPGTKEAEVIIARCAGYVAQMEAELAPVLKHEKYRSNGSFGSHDARPLPLAPPFPNPKGYPQEPRWTDFLDGEIRKRIPW